MSSVMGETAFKAGKGDSISPVMESTLGFLEIAVESEAGAWGHYQQLG